MSLADATSLKRVLASIFTRRGGNGRYTRRFEDLADTERAKLLSAVALAPDELPVIGGFECPEKWFLLTTNRIAWRHGVEVREVLVGDVQEAMVDFDDLRSRGLTKLDANQIHVVTPDGTHAIELEPGAPFSGVWNVLRQLGVRNARADRT